MSEPNLKAMTQAELLKYLEEDFMPRLLPKLAKLSDYSDENARLKAEVERLRASSFVTAVPVEQYERVVKAGEVVASALILFEIMSEEEIQKRLKAWSAAKEGKQP